MDKMKLDDAIKILTEMQKWRRAQPPYDGDTLERYKGMPYSAETFGHAIDFAISFMKGMQQQLSQKNDMKDFIKKLDMVSDNHNVPKEMRLEKFCDFIIKLFSTDSYKSGGFSPDIDIEKDKDYLELIAMWAEMVAKDMEQGRTADYMGRLYEQMYLLKSKASANGQFFTPESLCDLMARITDKDDAERKTKVINDCACGSGRTLLAHFMRVTSEDRANAGRYYYDAADIDLFTCKMCACNMMIHGMQGKVVCQDQLLLPTPTAIFYINEVRYPFPTPYYSIRVRYPKQEEEERKEKEGRV